MRRRRRWWPLVSFAALLVSTQSGWAAGDPRVDDLWDRVAVLESEVAGAKEQVAVFRDAYVRALDDLNVLRVEHDELVATVESGLGVAIRLGDCIVRSERVAWQRVTGSRARVLTSSRKPARGAFWVPLIEPECWTAGPAGLGGGGKVRR